MINRIATALSIIVLVVTGSLALSPSAQADSFDPPYPPPEATSGSITFAGCDANHGSRWAVRMVNDTDHRVRYEVHVTTRAGYVAYEHLVLDPGSAVTVYRHVRAGHRKFTEIMDLHDRLRILASRWYGSRC